MPLTSQEYNIIFKRLLQQIISKRQDYDLRLVDLKDVEIELLTFTEPFKPEGQDEQE